MSPHDLVDALVGEPESMWVRLTAHWMTRPTELHVRPDLSGVAVVDALAAAAAAAAARSAGLWLMSPEYLLALKVQASRVDRDADDLRFLARQCGAQTADDVLAIAARVLGLENLAPKAESMVTELLSSPPSRSE